MITFLAADEAYVVEVEVPVLHLGLIVNQVGAHRRAQQAHETDAEHEVEAAH